MRPKLVLSLTLVAVFALAPPAAAIEQKLVHPGGAVGSLGHSVAVQGDTAVVGAPSDDSSKGAVFVFQRSGDTWTRVAKLIASDAAGGARLGASVAIDGDTIVAGAPGSTDAAPSAVYTFARTGAAERDETAKLTASDGAAGDGLGRTVAIDGDTIVAGAPGDDVPFVSPSNPGAEMSGSAYTFATTGAAARMETAKLTHSGAQPFDELGTGVAIDGATIVVGARSDDGRKGSAFTFARTGASRNETAKLMASDGTAFGGPQNGDHFGESVAIDGDTIVVGAPLDDVLDNADRGSAYTFASTGLAARNETAKLTVSDGAAGENFGHSVAIAGTTIVVGAHNEGPPSARGAAYRFARTGVSRTETGKLQASDGLANHEFGFAVAVDGDVIAAGAPSGHAAYVFFPAAPPPPPQCSDGLDNDGDGKVDFGADPGCASAGDGTESPDPPPPPAVCADGLDNDGDGKIDFGSDPGCDSAADGSESPDPAVNPPGNNNPPGNDNPPLISAQGCLNTTATLSGKVLGPAQLGRGRVAQRAIFKGANIRTLRDLDRYCAEGGGTFRIGYPTARLNKTLSKKVRKQVKERVVLILTSSPRFTLSGIKQGDKVAVALAALKGEKKFKVGRNTWYVASGGGARLLVKTSGGVVREVGIGDTRLTRNPTETKRFLKTWQLG